MNAVEAERRHSCRLLGWGCRQECRLSTAFTIVELLVVMAIIIVLAGLILSTYGYVQKKGARARAEAEIAAMSAAMESYKADKGLYPTDAGTTETLDPTFATTAQYKAASSFLYVQLSGQNLNGSTIAGAKGYMLFKPIMLLRDNMSANVSATNKVTALRDPFGNPYGYSTMKAAGGTGGYNPTFDLWSTAGTTGGDQLQWIKNW